MADPFIGQIKMFGGNFAPRGWALCDGQLLPIKQNQALFSILGTTYGGDGRTTFGLPELRGRVPMHEGSGPGLSPRPLGQKSGAEDVTLTESQIPSHTHLARCDKTVGVGHANVAEGNAWANDAGTSTATYSSNTPDGDMASAAINNTGGSQAHTNIQPVLVVNFIIALTGVFPSRN
ncbi:MAG: tail fiber protein [Motiliproteus sp.]